jgi:hypothetical protein
MSKLLSKTFSLLLFAFIVGLTFGSARAIADVNLEDPSLGTDAPSLQAQVAAPSAIKQYQCPCSYQVDDPDGFTRRPSEPPHVAAQSQAPQETTK